jgi:hypothetical protein
VEIKIRVQMNEKENKGTIPQRINETKVVLWKDEQDWQTLIQTNQKKLMKLKEEGWYYNRQLIFRDLLENILETYFPINWKT